MHTTDARNKTVITAVVARTTPLRVAAKGAQGFTGGGGAGPASGFDASATGGTLTELTNVF
jgi:hypothetical protein